MRASVQSVVQAVRNGQFVPEDELRETILYLEDGIARSNRRGLRDLDTQRPNWAARIFHRIFWCY